LEWIELVIGLKFDQKSLTSLGLKENSQTKKIEEIFLKTSFTIAL